MVNLSKNKRIALRRQFAGCCAYCGEELPIRGWRAELIGENYVEGGIAAICKECSIAKGNATPEAFRAILAEQVERAQRHSINFRTALRFGLCQVKVEPVVFWFERCHSSSAIMHAPTLKPSHNTAFIA